MRLQGNTGAVNGTEPSGIPSDGATAAALRPYQIDIVADFEREVAAGRRRVIAVAPTGSGKTIVASSIINRAADGGKSVMVVAHRREIIRQTSDKLAAEGVAHGIVQAGFAASPRERVQVAAIQTLWARAMQRQSMRLPPADLLVIDEAHHAPAKTYAKVIEAYPGAILLGLTATPCRGDGRGLGGIFETLIECPQVAELIGQGYLVGTRVFAPIDPDLKGVETRTGDYVASQLAERMDRDELVGDIVTHWHKYGERRRTVCFAVDVEHSLHICGEFLGAGVRAEHIDGATPKPERDAVLTRLASGETEVVTNCMVLTEGWDMPEVSCCILARPTRRMGLYRQMVGRVLRPAEGKPDAIVLDHSGAVFRHGFVEDHVHWTLDPDRSAVSPTHAARLARGARLLECTQCGAIRIAGEPCPHFGFLPRLRARGDLGRIDRPAAADPEAWHGMLAFIAEERGYKPGWAAHRYKEKFGAWPLQRFVQPLEPNAAVLSWVRARNIAYAKAREAKSSGAAT